MSHPLLQTINKCLVRVTTLTLAVMAVKFSAIYLVPLAVLIKTHFKEIVHW
ncbi:MULTISPECIES: hypothetical protein [Salinivibrio]|uniref:hypothetical protein n=1 Tax=Salinivibrio TaxID=51366 RepID=UPI001428A5D7|nr:MULTISPECIES: hypothetical protein [Salinivibrio]